MKKLLLLLLPFLFACNGQLPSVAEEGEDLFTCGVEQSINTLKDVRANIYNSDTIDLLVIIAETEDGESLVNGSSAQMYVEEVEDFWNLHYPVKYNVTIRDCYTPGFVPVGLDAIVWSHYNLVVPCMDGDPFDRVLVFLPSKGYSFSGLVGSGSFTYITLINSGIQTDRFTHTVAHEFGHYVLNGHSSRQLWLDCNIDHVYKEYGGDDVMGNTVFNTCNPWNLQRLEDAGKLEFTPRMLDSLAVDQDTVIWLQPVEEGDAIYLGNNQYVYYRPSLNKIQHTESNFRRQSLDIPSDPYVTIEPYHEITVGCLIGGGVNVYVKRVSQCQ